MSEVQSARNTIVLLAILIEGGLVAVSLALGWLFDHHPLARIAHRGQTRRASRDN